MLHTGVCVSLDWCSAWYTFRQ